MRIQLASTHLTQLPSDIKQGFFVALAIVAIAEVSDWPLRHLHRSASAGISARIKRARDAAARVGIHPERGKLLTQLASLDRGKLGLTGKWRLAHVQRVLLSETPDNVLRSHSRRAYYLDLIQQFLRRCISLFRPYGLASAANLRILILAAIIVFIRHGHVLTLTFALNYLREIRQWVSEWFALVSLGAVVVIVAARSPLVDRIRARDEAAKDANRLLAQLFGKLSDLEHAATDYIALVERSRTVLISAATLKVAGGRYAWTHYSGLEAPSWYHENQSDRELRERQQRLDEASEALSDHLAQFRLNGLHTVARRLTLSIFNSLFECGVDFYGTEGIQYLRSRLLDSLAEIQLASHIEDLIKQMTAVEGDGGSEDFELLRNRIDNAVRDCACNLDARVARAYYTILHLRRINNFLNRRLHGTTRTRLASSFVR
jgi:hypothetical protein